jgi:hypothetical protein
MVFGKHAYEDMEVVIHEAKAKNLGEVNLREGLQAGKEIVLVDAVKREPGQSGAGHDVVDRRTVREKHAWGTGHGGDLRLERKG